MTRDELEALSERELDRYYWGDPSDYVETDPPDAYLDLEIDREPPETD